MQQEHIEKLESRIQYYIEQQSYLSLVRIDLQKYKHAYERSLKDGTDYSPFTPSKQNEEFELINFDTKDEIVALEEVVGDTKNWVE